MEARTPTCEPKDIGSQTRPVMPPRRPSRGTALSALESRVSELEQLTTSQGRELRIQFERIAQLRADCDILRMRFSKT